MFSSLKIINRFLLNRANKKFYSRGIHFISERLNDTKFSIRPLKIFEFKELLKNWVVKEGWNPGIYEYLPFYVANIHGHKGLFLNNKLIASLSAVRYSKDLAFMGLYIVDPQYREQGIGKILAKSVLNELSDCSLIGINAVQPQVENYQRKYGFIPYHTISRWSGEFNIQGNSSFSLMKKPEVEIKIVGKENLSINQLIDYDANVFSVPREAFFRKWVEMPKSYLLAAIKHDKICGYGVVSKCLHGYKLAPLFANDQEIAEKLYASFAHLLKKPTVFQVDVPDNNQNAIKLTKIFGLHKVFHTTRMYKGKDELIEKQDSSNVYALTTLEIG